MRFPKRSILKSFPLIAVLSPSLSMFCADQYPKRPLNDRVVVALVAGSSLPESVAADVRDHGLTFHASDQYLSRLKQVGADPMVIAVLQKARVIATEGTSHADDSTVLEHLFLAAEKMKANKLMDAAIQLTSASDNIEDHPELAFVMGEVMRREEGFVQSVQLYSRLVDIDPEFPEVHTKLSLVLYKTEDGERGMAEARAALARTPDNAEAHKNMGLNLQMLKEYDAAITEYQKALAIKPDYITIHYDLGVLYFYRGDYPNAIAENRKTLAIEPDNADAHKILAQALAKTGEYGTAITEYRQLLRLQPSDIEARMALANVLSNSGDREGGIEEFRKVIRMSPDASYCHLCFANLLMKADRLDEAAGEYRTAIQLDNVDADSHYGLGLVLEKKHQQDEALKEFLEAVRLGYDSWGVHLELSRIYLARNQNDDALTEAKQALSIDPSNGYIHEQIADIHVVLGNNTDAVMEYGQAINLLGHDTKDASDVDRKLGKFYEKLANYAMALRAYRGMYDSFPTETTKAEYEAARQRLNTHLPASALQEGAEAKADNPETLVARWAEKSREMQQAMAQKRWKDADEAGNAALTLVEQIQPADVGRLVGTIDTMGLNYQMQNRMDEAEQEFLKGLQVSEKLGGTTSLQAYSALAILGRFYFETKNYPQAAEYLTQSFDLAQKLYGQTFAFEMLDTIAQAYQGEHKFEKAEAAYKQMLVDDEVKNGPSSPSSAVGLEHLGVLYCDMGRYADAQGTLERAIAVDQKKFGENSSSLDRPLNELARALRGLGKEGEAKELDHRRALLAQNQPH